MTNMPFSFYNNSRQDDATLAQLLELASMVTRSEWNIDCGGKVSCVYQDSIGIVIGTELGWIKKYDSRGDLQVEYCAIVDESISVLASLSSVSAKESQLIVGTNKGSICAFSNDGSQLWYTNVSQWIGSIYLSLEKDGDVANIIVGTHDGMLYFLDRLGNILDSLQTPYTVLTSNPYKKDSIEESFFLGTRDGYFLAVNTAGQEIWKKSTDGWVYTLHQFYSGNDEFCILTGLQNGDLLAWDRDGNRLWKRSLGYWLSGLSTGDVNNDGLIEIIATTRNGSIYILSEVGDILWRLDIQEMVIGVICLEYAKNFTRIIIATYGGKLTCYHVAGFEAGLLHKIDGLVHDLPILPSLSENQFETLAALGLVAKRLVDIPYEKLRGAVEHHIPFDQKTQEYLLDHLIKSPLIQVWSRQVPAKIDTISCIQSVESNSRLIVGAVDGSVSCWTHDGKIIWRYLTMPGNWIWSARTGDINADGKDEIIIGTKGSKLHLLDETGKWLKFYPTQKGIRSVFVADIDRDTFPEFILGCEDANLYVLRTDGAVKWSYIVDGWIRSVIAADLNDDQRLEVICGSRGGIAYELDCEGNLLWKFDARNWIRVVYACDLNSDNKLELILGCDNGKVFAIGEDHQILWVHDIGFRIEAIRMINVDGQRQLLIGSESQTLYSLTAQGSVAWTFNLLGWVRDIEVVDLDNDGDMELVLSTFSVVQSVQKTNYYLQVWKILSRNDREKFISFAQGADKPGE